MGYSLHNPFHCDLVVRSESEGVRGDNQQRRRRGSGIPTVISSPSEIKAYFAQAYMEELLEVRSEASYDPCWSCQHVVLACIYGRIRVLAS
jgi:hypothetical protein